MSNVSAIITVEHWAGGRGPGTAAARSRKQQQQQKKKHEGREKSFMRRIWRPQRALDQRANQSSLLLLLLLFLLSGCHINLQPSRRSPSTPPSTKELTVALSVTMTTTKAKRRRL